MKKDSIPMKSYCAKSKYGLHIQDIIKTVVNYEDELNHEFVAPEIPKFEIKDPIKLTPTFIVAFAGNIIKSVLP
jgi:hypothetical protein